MRDYIDLVLCETCNGKREVFQAPSWSHLKESDMVIVESGEGEEMTNVVCSLTLRKDEVEEFEFITAVLNLPHTLEELNRIKSKVVFKALDYKED